MQAWRRIGWAGRVVHTAEMRNECRILIAEVESKRPFRKPGNRWRIILKLILWKQDGIQVGQYTDRRQMVVKTV